MKTLTESDISNEDSTTAAASDVKDKTSDSNCQPSCGLSLGSSEKFIQDVEEQQDLIAQKGHRTSPLFTTPEEQQLFMPILRDVILNTFDDANEQHIFRTALLGMKQNYGNILDGSKSTISMFPDVFDYDSRIKPHNTAVFIWIT